MYLTYRQTDRQTDRQICIYRVASLLIIIEFIKNLSSEHQRFCILEYVIDYSLRVLFKSILILDQCRIVLYYVQSKKNGFKLHKYFTDIICRTILEKYAKIICPFAVFLYCTTTLQLCLFKPT